MKNRIIVPLHFEGFFFFPASCPPLEFQCECSLNTLHNVSWVLTDETNWFLMDFAQQHTPNDTSVITIKPKQHPDEVTECKAHLRGIAFLVCLRFVRKCIYTQQYFCWLWGLLQLTKASLTLQYWITSHFWQRTSSKIPAVFSGGSVGYNELMCWLD